MRRASVDLLAAAGDAANEDTTGNAAERNRRDSLTGENSPSRQYRYCSPALSKPTRHTVFARSAVLPRRVAPIGSSVWAQNTARQHPRKCGQ
jgi:hypothetical protein